VLEVISKKFVPRSQRRAQYLRSAAFYMHGTEMPAPHHLRYAARITTIGLVGTRLRRATALAASTQSNRQRVAAGEAYLVLSVRCDAQIVCASRRHQRRAPQVSISARSDDRQHIAVALGIFIEGRAERVVATDVTAA